MAQRLVDAPDPVWLTLDEAARFLGMSGKTLQGLIDEGRFPPGVHTSRKILMWPWLDVVAYAHLAMRLPALFWPGHEFGADS